MKKSVVVIVLFLMAFCTLADGALPGTTVRLKDRGNGTARDVYLLIGQSNMAGRGQLTAGNRVSTEGIVKFDKNNQWVEAVEPLHFDKNSAGAGIGASFAVEMRKVSGGREIGLVPCAVGGSAMLEWVPGGALYSNALLRCRTALSAGGKLKGILWHQGESDCPNNTLLETYTVPYAGRLAVMINRLRMDLNAPGLPFVAGELTTASYRSHDYRFDEISKITRELMPTIANCGFASSEGLTMNNDGLHFDTPSLRTFGERYAAEMIRLQAAEK